MKPQDKEEVAVTDEMSEVPATIPIEETPSEETAPSGDILVQITDAATSGMLFKDFKIQLAMGGFMRDSDDLQVGRLNRIGQLHCAIVNIRESSSSVQLLIGGKLTPMKKPDFDKIYNEGIFAGSDLITYTDDDDMVLLKGLYVIKTDGSLHIV